MNVESQSLTGKCLAVPMDQNLPHFKHRHLHLWSGGAASAPDGWGAREKQALESSPSGIEKIQPLKSNRCEIWSQFSVAWVLCDLVQVMYFWVLDTYKIERCKYLLSCREIHRSKGHGMDKSHHLVSDSRMGSVNEPYCYYLQIKTKGSGSIGNKKREAESSPLEHYLSFT